jgi:hypothetical protein
MIDLLSLVAANRVVQEEREIRDQVQVVAETEGLDLRQRVAGRVLPLTADAVAIRVPASVLSMEPNRSISPASIARWGEASVAFHVP